MKLKIKLGVVLCTLLLAISGCATRLMADSSNTLTQPHAVEEVRQVLQHGDWLVSRGVHYTDNFVAAMSNAPFSHAAIYDADTDEVIEAENQGVHVTKLADFIAKSQRVMVIRPQWATPDNSTQAVQLARSWIGKGYNLSGLVGLNMPDRYYCTQLVIAAYKPTMTEKPDNPIPWVIKPSQMHHWGRIMYDTGP